MLPNKKPTLRVVYTNSFGDTSDVKIDLKDDTIESVFWAIRQAIMGCGFSEKSVDGWFPPEV